MKKKDIILILALVVVALVCLVSVKLLRGQDVTDKGEVVVSVRGDILGTYSLNKNQTIEIKGDYGTNVLQIKDGKASMLSAGCPDQICVDHLPIHNKNDMIICLPNQIIVEVTEGEQSNTDAIVQ